MMVFPAALDAVTDEVDKILKTFEKPRGCVVCSKEQTPGDTQGAPDGASLEVHSGEDAGTGSGTTVRPCSRCKVHRYCGEECQRKHWMRGHKRLCTHAQTLVGLARLDFSTFRCQQDWSFAVKPLEPADQERHYTLLHEQSMARMCPSGSLSNLRAFLDRIGDKVLAEDPLSAPICAQMGLNSSLARPDGWKKGEAGSLDEYRTGVRHSGYFRPVKEHFLHKALVELCDMHIADRKKRHHAVGMGPAWGHSVAKSKEGKGEEELQLLLPFILEALFLVIPLWQRELGARGMWWFFEAHDVLLGGFWAAYGAKDDNGNSKSESHWDAGRRSKKKGLKSYPGKDGWSCRSCMAIHAGADSRASFSGATSLTAYLAEGAANACKHDGVVVRVLRATGNRSLKQPIADILKERDTKRAENVFTLWIREDITVCGKFDTPYNPKKPLKEQLFAAMQGDPIQQLLRERLGMGSGMEYGDDRDFMDADAGDGFASSSGPTLPARVCRTSGVLLQSCSACGQREGRAHDGTFSGKQRRMPQDTRRCALCVRTKRPASSAPCCSECGQRGAGFTKSQLKKGNPKCKECTRVQGAPGARKF